jgi:WD40 repeat protein
MRISNRSVRWIVSIAVTFAARDGLGVPSSNSSPNGPVRNPIVQHPTSNSVSTDPRADIRLIPQTGHTSRVNSIAFAPNGSWVLTGSQDQTAKLWDVKSGAELRTFSGHINQVSSVAFSLDGRYVLTGSFDETAKLWDATSGAEVNCFPNGPHPPPHDHLVHSVALSPNGRYVLFGRSKAATLWDVRNGLEMRTFSGHSGQVDAVAFSPDGCYVLTGSRDKTAKLWDTLTGAELHTFSGHSERVQSVAFSADGRYILTASWDKKAKLWDTQSGAEVQTFSGHRDHLDSVAFSPDGRYVLTGSRDKTAKLWAASGGALVRTFSGHDGAVTAVAFSPDGTCVLTGSADNTAKLWDAEEGSEILTFYGHSAKVHAVAVSSHGRYLLTGGSKVAHLWETQDGAEVRRLSGPNYSLSAVAFSPDGHYALTGGKKTATVWDTNTGSEIRTLAGHSGHVTSVAYSPGGQYVLTGSDDNTAKIWEWQSGLTRRTFAAHSDGVTSVAFSSDGAFVVTGSLDDTAKLWETRSGVEVRAFSGHSDWVTSVAISADSCCVLTGSSDRTAKLWGAQNGAELHTFSGHTDRVQSVAISSDNRYALTGGWDNVAKLWSIKTGAELQTFAGHTGFVQSVAFGPNGRFVLTGSLDGTVKLWDPLTGRELGSLISFDDGTWAVIDSDGHFDTNNLDGNNALHWIASDDPMTALPLEVFMRDYYEPRLLARILEGESSSLPSIAKLNRVQSLATVANIQRVANSTDIVSITVEVASVRRTFTRDGKPVSLTSGVYDLRLFRDGQIVGQWPEPRPLEDAPTDHEAELRAWREQSEIHVDPTTGKAIHTFTVRLPRKPGLKQTDFSAYAFNSDRVKSATAHKVFDLPTDLPRRKGRAWLITMGVNSYESPAWNLRFAADDARSLRTMLTSALGKRDDYEVVQAVSLISDSLQQGADSKPATKRNLQTVLDQLAGRIDDPDKRILKATPEDLVMISFSGHGYADGRGNFYFIPHDIGEGNDKHITPEILQHSISSDELTAWLRYVDAGQMVIIIDACQSAATVGSGFKPGPMGSRGLGQLAYDKRIRILAASQSDEFALETSATKHGLLTYALVNEGLGDQQADYKPKDHRILLSEWLQYAADQVPKLAVDGPGKRGAWVEWGEHPSDRSAIQRPALFDFTKAKDDLVLMEVAASPDR